PDFIFGSNSVVNIANSVGLSFPDVEDWLCVENEHPNSTQLSNESSAVFVPNRERIQIRYTDYINVNDIHSEDEPPHKKTEFLDKCYIINNEAHIIPENTEGPVMTDGPGGNPQVIVDASHGKT
ncbi:unnamed protein product, partial [Pocillopora meandrina]